MEKTISVIFGGNSGIGLETARVISSKGTYVSICARNTESVKKELKGNYDFEDVDVKDISSIQKAINNIIKKHKKIDSLVYSLSPKIKNILVSESSWEDYNEQINVQIRGFYEIVRIVSKLNMDNQIKFVVVLTEYCFGKPPARISSYVTAKYGLMGLVKSFASEFNPKKFTFNMVSPGMVDTKLLSDLNPKLMEITAYNNPMKRIGKPLDVANVISFLVSKESEYLNGINIPINGGNIFF